MVAGMLWTLAFLGLLLWGGPDAARAADVAPAGADAADYQLLQIESLKDKRRFPGKLFLPKGAGAPVPVLVMVPGTDGVDARQDFYRPALLAAGIGTFELDTKTGVFTGEKDRPDPAFFLPIVFGALRALRAMPNIDPERIALLGWSAGGLVTLRAAWSRYRREWLSSGERGFSAYIGIYGGCSRARDLDFVPVLILVGDKDTYGANRSCDDFARDNRQVSLTVYPGAHHGFDKPNVAKGPPNRRMEWKEDAAMDARRRVVAFLAKVFRLPT